MKWWLVSGALIVSIFLWAFPASAAGLNLSWNDNSNNETSFELERQLGACGVDRQPWVQIVVLAANITTYQDRTLNEGEVYCYRVRACNTLGCSAYSGVAGDRVRRPPKGTEFFMSELKKRGVGLGLVG